MRLSIKRYKDIVSIAVAIVLLSLMMAILVGCANDAAENTYMVDKTTEREVSIPQSQTVLFSALSEDGYRALAELVRGKYRYEGLTYGKLESQESATDAAKQAVMDFYGDDFIDLEPERKTAVCLSEVDENVWLYYNGNVYVALKADTGELLACVDVRISESSVIEAYKRDNSLLNFKADIYDYSAAELKFYYMICLDRHYTTQLYGELPTAQSAYEGAVGIAKSIRFGSLSGNGREYKVYFSEKSNAWIVVGTKITLALSKETGETLYIGRTIK